MAPPINRFPLQVQVHLYEMEAKNLSLQAVQKIEERADAQKVKIVTRQMNTGLYLYRHPDYLAQLQDCLAEDLGMVIGVPLKAVSHLAKPFTTDPLQQLNQHLAYQLTQPAYDQLCLTFAKFAKEDPTNFTTFCKLQSNSNFSKQEQFQFLKEAIPSFGQEFGTAEKEAQQVFNEVRGEMIGLYTPQQLVERGNTLERPSLPEPVTFKKGFRLYRSLKEIETKRIQSAKALYSDIGDTIRCLDSHQNPEGKEWKDIGKLRAQQMILASTRRWINEPSKKEINEATRTIYQTSKDPEEKARAKRVLDIDHAQQVYGILQQTDQGVATIMEAMDNAGIPISPKVRQRVRLGRTIIRTMASAPMMVISPFDGVMGMIRGVGEMIGMTRTQGPSLADLHHQQLLEEIQSLQWGQKEILKKQQKTQEILIVLGEMQAETIERIKALDEKVARKMLVINEKIDHLLSETQAIKQSYVEKTIHLELELARKLRDDMESKSSFDRNFNGFTSYQALKTFCQQVGFDIVYEGTKALRHNLQFIGVNDSSFAITIDSQQQLHQHFDQLTLYLFENFTRLTINRERGYAALMYPSRTVDCIQKKRKRVQEGSLSLPGLPLKLASLPSSENKGFLRTPYLYHRVQEYALCIIRLHPLYQYFRKDKLLPLEKVAECVNENSLTLLRTMEARISVALIHQSLLGGDLMLPLFYEDFRKNPERILKLAAPNEILAHNFMVFAFREGLLAKKRPLIDYHTAYHSRPDDWALKKVLGEPWQFRWNQESQGWEASFDKLYYSLPEPAQVINGELELPQEVNGLFDLKGRVQIEMQKYPEVGSNFGLSTEELELYLFLLHQQKQHPPPIKPGEIYVHSSKL
jgi:hypothetical protein